MCDVTETKKETEAERLVLDAYLLVTAAIRSGDWTVDGACDPALWMDNAERYLVGRMGRNFADY